MSTFFNLCPCATVNSAPYHYSSPHPNQMIRSLVALVQLVWDSAHHSCGSTHHNMHCTLLDLPFTSSQGFVACSGSSSLFQIEKNAYETGVKSVSALRPLYIAFLQNEVPRLIIARAINCKCVEYEYNVRRTLNEENIELESELGETRRELDRTVGFLRVAESRVNEQRAKIRSLEKELQLARDDINFNLKRISRFREISSDSSMKTPR
ncbi:hypothetical protein F4824DRAFT_470824 [Ustulina deusta]|nr:hypothetical protein F4824DRAFT_470824 [Ustulina deusta]